MNNVLNMPHPNRWIRKAHDEAIDLALDTRQQKLDEDGPMDVGME